VIRVEAPPFRIFWFVGHLPILDPAGAEPFTCNDTMTNHRPPGLYEEFVTRRLEAALAEIRAERRRSNPTVGFIRR